MIDFPEAVFFDWDGTLADSYYFLEAAHGHTRVALGLTAFEEGEFAKRYFGQPREKLYNDLYAPRQDEARGIFEAYVRENHLNLKPLAQAEDVLKFFAARNVPMGVVSNKKGEFIREEIKHFGWEKYFRIAIGAGEAENDKPSADALLLAIKKAGIESPIGKIWYVGDTATDLACARNAGCVSVFVAHLSDSPNLIAEYRPDLAVKNCAKLCGFLLQSYGK